MAHTTKEILIDYSKPDLAMKTIKTMPLAEQEPYVAEWMMAIIGDFRMRPLPTPPHEVQNYLKMNPDIRKKMNTNPQEYKNFWDNPEVKRHFDDVDRIHNLNHRSKTALSWLQKYFKHDYARLEQIQSLLNDFLNDTDKVVEQPAWSN